MNELEQKQAKVNSIADKLIPRFGKAWDVKVVIEELNFPSVMAECRTQYAERKACVAIDPRLPLEDIPQCVAHEIAHLVTADYERMITNFIAIKTTKGDCEFIARVFLNELERTMDTFAAGILELIGEESGTKDWMKYKD